MKTGACALLLLAVAAPTLAAEPGDHRFPAVTMLAGEGVNVNVSNVPIPLPTATPVAPCPAVVSFFAGDGSAIGSPANLSLDPGVSASVQAASPHPGLVRATVSIGDPGSAQFCALKSVLELYDIGSGATRVLLPSSACIGLGQCAVTLQ